MTPTATNITLRPYQVSAVRDIRAALKSHRRVLYQAPTGSGKTVLFTYMAASGSARGTRLLICVHRNELIRQTSEALDAWGVRHGVISPHYPATEAPVQVAMIQTLARRKSLPIDPHLIVLDEAHHATARTWETVLDRYPEARSLGVTATPCRMTGKGLAHIYDTLIQGPTVPWLVEHGYLAPAEVYAPPCPVDMSGLRSRAGDYRREQVEELMNRREITGDVLEHYRRYLAGAPSIAFCVSIAHAEAVAESFRQAGYAAASIDGSMGNAERDRLIRDLGDGRLHVLTSCDLISEGVDVPVVTGALLLRPTKSTGLHLQQCGRVLRPAPGKRCAVILDHVGNCHKHGLPDQHREWSLEHGHVPRETEGDPDDPGAVRQCPECFAAHTGDTCPICGYQHPPKPRPEPEVVRGELQHITGRERDELIEKARSLKELGQLGKQLGYKPGWAWHQWHKRRTRKREEVAV